MLHVHNVDGLSYTATVHTAEYSVKVGGAGQAIHCICRHKVTLKAKHGHETVCLVWQASTSTKQFKSHCAPEALTQAVPAQMTVKELKAALEGMQVEGKGSKAALVARLQEAQAAAGALFNH